MAERRRQTFRNNVENPVILALDLTYFSCAAHRVQLNCSCQADLQVAICVAKVHSVTFRQFHDMADRQGLVTYVACSLVKFHIKLYMLRSMPQVVALHELKVHFSYLRLHVVQIHGYQAECGLLLSMRIQTHHQHDEDTCSQSQCEYRQLLTTAMSLV